MKKRLKEKRTAHIFDDGSTIATINTIGGGTLKRFISKNGSRRDYIVELGRNIRYEDQNKQIENKKRRSKDEL